jgi:aspartate kinase
MIVMKFGGTSVRNADALRQVADIVIAQEKQHSGVVVVLSATSGTTSALLSLASMAANGRDYESAFAELAQHHVDIARDLNIPANSTEVLLDECRQHLEATAILGVCTSQTYDAIAGYGELLSTTLFALFLTQSGVNAAWVDARRCIVTDDSFQSAIVDAERTQSASNEVLQPLLAGNTIVVTQGFVGATSTGIPTTLGRGGSDYSAALLGSCLDAREIHIWTDVSGVYTCDPRIVASAIPLPSISFQDIRTLALYGAKVLHPETVAPAVAAGIPVRVLNTFEPEAVGTVISEHDDLSRPITAVSMIRPCRCIHTDAAGARALEAIPILQQNVALSIETRSGCMVVIHEATSDIQLAIDVASVGHVSTSEAVACLVVCGPKVDTSATVAVIAERLRSVENTTISSLQHPRCVVVTTPLSIADHVCGVLHALVISSSSEAS